MSTHLTQLRTQNRVGGRRGDYTASDPGEMQSPRIHRGLLEMFESQMITRHLDLVARELRARDAGFDARPVADAEVLGVARARTVSRRA